MRSCEVRIVRATHPPERWTQRGGSALQVSILLRVEPEPFIEATAAGHTVVYRPSLEEPPGCD